jgi:hypothetical protein
MSTQASNTSSLKAIMTKAWNIFRAMARRMSFADALRCAWAWMRGKRVAYETSYVDWNCIVVKRSMGFGVTDQEAGDARRAEWRAHIARGLRPTGAVQFSIATH